MRFTNRRYKIKLYKNWVFTVVLSINIISLVLIYFIPSYYITVCNCCTVCFIVALYYFIVSLKFQDTKKRLLQNKNTMGSDLTDL